METDAFKSPHNLNKKATRLQETPLHMCVRSRKNYDAKDELNCDHFKCFKLLSCPGVDINAVTIQGVSPFLKCVFVTICGSMTHATYCML